MLRLAVVAKTESIAKEMAEWSVSGEKSLEKAYDLSGRTATIKAFPFWPELKGAKPVGDAVLIVAYEASDLPALEETMGFYSRVPTKFIAYKTLSDDVSFEAKWGAKGFEIKKPEEFVEKLITENNNLVKLIASVFKNFDKDGSGFIETGEIKGLAKELGSEIPEGEVAQIMAEIDMNKDGKISLDEFVEWWKTGRQGKSTKMGNLVEGWLQKNKFLQDAADALAKFTAGPEESKAKFAVSQFAIHANRVKVPGIVVEFSVMTAGKMLDAEYQLFSGAIGLPPKEPFIGLAFGCKNPKNARETLENLVNATIAMATSAIPPAEMILSHVEPKFGETSNKAVFCFTPSAQGKKMVDGLMQAFGPFLGLILPEQFLQLYLTFATDFEKIITADKAFYELFMDGITLEVKGQMNENTNDKVSALLKDPGLTASMPKKIARTLKSFFQGTYVGGLKGELEFEIDEELKTMIKEQAAGLGPLAMPLKDLKMMITPQAKGVIQGMPLFEMAHNLFKDEVTSMELFLYIAGFGGIKLSFDLPGLGKLLSLD